MDDITRKRLEAERSRMPALMNAAAAFVVGARGSHGHDAHNEELYRLGLPPEVSPGVASMLIGLPIGMMMNHTTVQAVLDFFDLVVRAPTDLAADLYDHTEEGSESGEGGSTLGDRLEDYFDSLEYAARAVGIHFQVTLSDVFLWARLLRNGVAELALAIEDQADPTLPGEEVRAIAARVGRFMAETLATILVDHPKVS